MLTPGHLCVALQARLLCVALQARLLCVALQARLVTRQPLDKCPCPRVPLPPGAPALGCPGPQVLGAPWQTVIRAPEAEFPPGPSPVGPKVT